VTLVRGGRKYFDLLIKMLDGARDSIHLQVYILNNDETGKTVIAALERAAARGVLVYVMVDGYASQSLPREVIHQVREAGVNFRFFEPILKSHNFYFGRRLHHKVVVADEKCGMVGGLNIADRYNDMPGIEAWMDWGVFVEGEVAAQLFNICEELWRKSSRYVQHPHKHIPLPADLLQEHCLVRVRRNDFVRNKNQVSASYFEMFNKATEQITIMSSYFLPGRVIRKKIEAASKRGVNIRLILTGNSDVRIVKYAERYIYAWIFKNKISLYEYQKNVLHGKLSTYDDKWVTAGSYNVNFISAYASIELNLDISDEQFAKTVKHTIDEIIKNDCAEILENEYGKKYNYFQRAVQKVAYECIQAIFFLFTFYFRPRRN
jgi:cardiolipin synthase